MPIYYGPMTARGGADKEKLFALARRLVWWKTPEDALAERNRFLAQMMSLGTWQDIEEAKQFCPGAAFRDALRHAPPGVFEPRSWSYWHRLLEVLPIPRLPTRNSS